MLRNLRTIRHDRRLTQADLARLTNLNPTYLSHIERGLAPRDPHYVALLARALDVPEAVLTGEAALVIR